MSKRDQRHGALLKKMISFFMSKKGDRKKALESSSDDFISKMPNDVLVMILSLLPIKSAVVTSCLSKRWRFLWCNLIRLNFDGNDTLDKKPRRYIEWKKYVNQVNGVISSYNHPMVQDFRIRFNFYYPCNKDIDEWVQFAVNKKVVNVELNFSKIVVDYELRSSMWMSSTSKFGELVPLKTLILKGVNVRDESLHEILTNSPHLEMILIHESRVLIHASVGGRALNLKHFEIVNCRSIRSIRLYDFDLETFIYKGSDIDLHLNDLRNLKKIDMCQQPVGLDSDLKNCSGNYEFPLSKWMSSKSTVLKFVSLKTLFLKSGYVRDEILHELLANSPYLKTISIHESRYLTHISVGGRALNLKHFEIVDCDSVRSIHVYDLDLESFTYDGPEISLLFTDLPKLKKVDMCQRHVGLNSDLFGQISFCASSLHTLCFKLFRQQNTVKLDSLPELQNLKKLILTIGIWEDNCLLELASIVHTCPNLETFIVKLIWFLPSKRRTIAGHVVTNYPRRTIAGHVATNHPHQHLKLFKILGYQGQIWDFELVAYIINNAVALEKIVIDPRCQLEVTGQNILKEEKDGRRFAKRKLKRIVPTGVELVIL